LLGFDDGAIGAMVPGHPGCGLRARCHRPRLLFGTTRRGLCLAVFSHDGGLLPCVHARLLSLKSIAPG
jgi:hypothetical protein